MQNSPLRHLARQRPLAAGRVVYLGCRDLALAAGDKDPAIVQKRGRVARATHRQRAGGRPTVAIRVPDLGRVEGGSLLAQTAFAASDDEDPPVVEQRGGVLGSRLRHLTGRGPLAHLARCRVEKLGQRYQRDDLVGPTADEQPAVG